MSFVPPTGSLKPISLTFLPMPHLRPENAQLSSTDPVFRISNLTHLETQPSPKQRSLSEQSSEGDPSAMHRSRHKHARVFLRPKESERRRKGRALRKRLLGEGFEAWRSQMEQNSDAKGEILDSGGDYHSLTDNLQPAQASQESRQAVWRTKMRRISIV